MARDAGAKRVIMASCAPPIRYSNVYGIDMPSRSELVAYERTEAQIAEYIGADMVIFQTLEDLIESCRKFNPAIETFDCSVFTGKYVTGGVDEEYLAHIQSLREDSAKLKKAQTTRLNLPEEGAAGWRSQTPQANGNGHGTGGDQSQDEHLLGCSGPMNGADAIGLYNEPSKIKRSNSWTRNGNGEHAATVGLSNSFYAGIAEMDINETAATAGVSEGANAVAGGAGAAAQ